MSEDGEDEDERGGFSDGSDDDEDTDCSTEPLLSTELDCFTALG